MPLARYFGNRTFICYIISRNEKKNVYNNIYTVNSALCNVRRPIVPAGPRAYEKLRTPRRPCGDGLKT